MRRVLRMVVDLEALSPSGMVDVYRYRVFVIMKAIVG